jgi:hypothetical protein
MSEKSDWEQGYDQARRRFYGERKVLTARIAKLEATVEVGADIAKAYENRVSEIVALSNETVGKLNSRIAELEGLAQQLVWVGNDLLTDNTNPVAITLFSGLAFRSKELLP